MKLLMLGNSDTSGAALEPGELPWPDIVARRLAATWETEVTVEHRRFAPFGPKAVSYALRCVEETQPDLVMLILAAYNGVIGYVHLRVRQRWGERAERWYLRLERGFESSTRRDGFETPVNSWSRRLARRLVGTATYAPLSEVIATYQELLHALSRLEGVQVLVAGDARFAQGRHDLNPGLNENILRVHAGVRPVVEEHRFLWVDGETGFTAHADRESLFLADGMHISPAGHELFAGLVLDRLVDEPSVRPPSGRPARA